MSYLGYMNLQDWKTVSEIFNNIAIALAAISGGIWAGLKAFIEFVSSRRKSSYKNEMRKRYPREKLNETFKIVDHEKSPGKLYLIDLKKKEKYWIQSGPTLLDIGFFWDDAQRISEEEFHKYKEGPGILTVGTPGQ